MLDVLGKSFDVPDETRSFEKGKLEIVRIGGMTLGRASYEPGWKWSTHVSPLAGTAFCEVEHVGLVLSGRAMAAMSDGRQLELSAGTLFYIPPVAHDAAFYGCRAIRNVRTLETKKRSGPNSVHCPRSKVRAIHESHERTRNALVRFSVVSWIVSRFHFWCGR